MVHVHDVSIYKQMLILLCFICTSLCVFYSITQRYQSWNYIATQFSQFTVEHLHQYGHYMPHQHYVAPNIPSTSYVGSAFLDDRFQKDSVIIKVFFTHILKGSKKEMGIPEVCVIHYQNGTNYTVHGKIVDWFQLNIPR